VTPRSAALIAVCVLLLGVAALTGCGRKAVGPTIDPSTGQPAVEQPAAEQSGTGPATSASGTANSGKVDVKSIEDQLDAMQRELDGLSMPSDNDFKGAEGAVY